MEQYRSVREARRTFANALLTAAAENQRVVIVRHGIEVGAVINMDDLQFLRERRALEAQRPLEVERAKQGMSRN